MHEYTAEQLHDALGIVEKAIEAVQHMSEGNTHIAWRQLLSLAKEATQLGNELREMAHNGALTLIEDDEDREV